MIYQEITNVWIILLLLPFFFQLWFTSDKRANSCFLSEFQFYMYTCYKNPLTPGGEVNPRYLNTFFPSKSNAEIKGCYCVLWRFDIFLRETLSHIPALLLVGKRVFCYIPSRVCFLNDNILHLVYINVIVLD